MPAVGDWSPDSLYLRTGTHSQIRSHFRRLARAAAEMGGRGSEGKEKVEPLLRAGPHAQAFHLCYLQGADVGWER